MAQSNIESLFQAVVPPADRNSSASRWGSHQPGFDDHLSKASTSVYPQPEESAPSISAQAPPRPTPAPQENKAPACPPPAKSEDAESVDTAASEQEGEHDDQASNEATAAAGANGATPVREKKEAAQNSEQEAAVVVKEELGKSSAEPEAKKTNADATAQKVEVETSAADAVLPVLEVQPEDAAAAGADAVEQAEPEQTEEPEVASQKATKKEKRSNSAPAETSAKQQVAEAKVVDNAQATSVAVSTEAAGEVEQSPAPAAPKQARKSGTAERAIEDDSTKEIQGEASAPAPTEATTATKVTVAAAASISVPKVGDAGSEGSDSKDSGTAPVKAAATSGEANLGPLDRLNRAASEVTSSNRASETGDAPRIDPARFVNRVAKALHTAQERGGTLQLRLSPPELGAMRIQLTVKDGVMSAALETENAGARRVLLDNLPALRERLAEQNIRIEKFDVNVQQENTGGQANPQGSNQNPYQPQPERNSPRIGRVQQRGAEPVVPQPAATTTAAQISSSGINLFV